MSKGQLQAKDKDLVSQSQLTQLGRLELTLKDGRNTVAQAESDNQQMIAAITRASLIQSVRSQLHSFLPQIRALENTRLGFLTDRNPKTTRGAAVYDDDTILDVVTEALLDGARLVGNEFNVIAGGYYRTKEQLKRRLDEWEGLSELRITLGVPQSSAGGALVACSASWKLNGHDDCMEFRQIDGGDNRIAVRVNAGQGVDAIHGKVRRKLYFRILETLSGKAWEETEEHEPQLDDAIDVALNLDGDQQKTESPGTLNALALQLSECNTSAEVEAVREAAAAIAKTEEDWEEVNEICDQRLNAMSV